MILFSTPVSNARLCWLVSLCIIIVLFNSCKKDNRQSNTTIALTPTINVDIAALKTIYNNNIKNTGLAIQSNGGKEPNLIRTLDVDWSTYTVQKFTDSSVIAEFEMNNDTALFTLKKVSTNDTMKYINRTKVSFLKYADGSRVNFFTKIIEDLSAPGSKSVINDLHYMQIPLGFNGMILYYSLDQHFINGYSYKDGFINGVVSFNNESTSTKAINSVKTDAISVCTTHYIYQTFCQYSGPPEDPRRYFNGCEDTLISSFTVCQSEGGGTGGVGGGSSGGGGGGTTPNPCKPAIPTIVEAVKNGKLTIQNLPAPPPVGGGGGGTPTTPCPPSAPPTDIKNKVKDPCLKAMVDAATSAGLNNYTSNLANKIFGNNPNFDLNFSQSNTLASSVDGVTNCQGMPSTQNYFIADVELNGNTLPKSSKEYIAATITHEILHAYWTYSGKLGEFNQHTEMANNYILTMGKDLKAMFPSISTSDAEALAWGGLGDTQAWKDMQKNDPTKANNIVTINSQYKNATGTKGQRCK